MRFITLISLLMLILAGYFTGQGELLIGLILVVPGGILMGILTSVAEDNKQ